MNNDPANGFDANGSPETELPVPAIAKQLTVVDTRSSQMAESPPQKPDAAAAEESQDARAELLDEAERDQLAEDQREAAASAGPVGVPSPADAAPPISPPHPNQIPAIEPRFTLERLKSINEIDAIGNGEGNGTAIFDSVNAELIPGVAAILIATLVGMPPSATVHLEVDVPDGSNKLVRRTLQCVFPIRRLYLCNKPRSVKSNLKFKRNPDPLWDAHLHLADKLPDVAEECYVNFFKVMSEREKAMEAAAQNKQSVNTAVPQHATGVMTAPRVITNDKKLAWNIVVDYIKAQHAKNPNFNFDSPLPPGSPPHLHRAIQALHGYPVNNPNLFPPNGFIIGVDEEVKTAEPLATTTEAPSRAELAKSIDDDLSTKGLASPQALSNERAEAIAPEDPNSVTQRLDSTEVKS